MKRKKRGLPRHLLVTAGPTREPIDPVRFISNMSTGTLGYDIARLAQKAGYRVTLISGPTGLEAPKGVTRIQVETAADMEKAVLKVFPRADGLIMSAAVADFRPVRVAARKIKRSGVPGSLRLMQLELVENEDILARVSELKRPKQVIIGFALETERLIPNARGKMRSKGLDAIVATLLSARDRSKGPFGDLPVNGAILWATGQVHSFRREPKNRLAKRILKTMDALLSRKNGS
ncbi:MAG: phosphopantothenoylcysteine decarboxylase [Candidatus Omnitrophica bacterium]|nr:phosphopantothenoylcysteine decarboxylase [Candidatus Omnitrophota bacterium]